MSSCKAVLSIAVPQPVRPSRVSTEIRTTEWSHLLLVADRLTVLAERAARAKPLPGLVQSPSVRRQSSRWPGLPESANESWALYRSPARLWGSLRPRSGATVAAELPQQPAANSGDRHLRDGPGH
jgi:hypothetical protein